MSREVIQGKEFKNLSDVLNKNIINKRLVNCKIEDMYAERCNGLGLTLADSSIDGCTFASISMVGGVLGPNSHLNRGYVYNVHFYPAVGLLSSTVNQYVFFNCTFKGAVFRKSVFKHCSFIRCSFINCKFFGSSFKHSSFSDVCFYQCKTEETTDAPLFIKCDFKPRSTLGPNVSWASTFPTLHVLDVRLNSACKCRGAVTLQGCFNVTNINFIEDKPASMLLSPAPLALANLLNSYKKENGGLSSTSKEGIYRAYQFSTLGSDNV